MALSCELLCKRTHEQFDRSIFSAGEANPRNYECVDVLASDRKTLSNEVNPRGLEADARKACVCYGQRQTVCPGCLFAS
jgi:hypothetical protein